MNSEQIAHALRLVAMGRVNHPEVLELSDKLAALMAPATPQAVEVVADESGMVEVSPGFEVSAEAMLKAEPGAVIPVMPKRRKKAE